mgnify:FL=1
MRQYGESKVDSTLVLAISAIIIGNYFVLLLCLMMISNPNLFIIKIGLIFIISGAIVSGIAYMEITPPNYDVNMFNR